MDPVRLTARAGYNLYKDWHTGELKSIARKSPPNLHNILPTDVVELSQKRSDDFPEGADAAVKFISSRSPNVLQLEKDGQTTFVNYTDVTLIEEKANREDRKSIDNPIRSNYLLWP